MEKIFDIAKKNRINFTIKYDIDTNYVTIEVWNNIDNIRYSDAFEYYDMETLKSKLIKYIVNSISSKKYGNINDPWNPNLPPDYDIL